MIKNEVVIQGRCLLCFGCLLLAGPLYMRKFICIWKAEGGAGRK